MVFESLCTLSYSHFVVTMAVCLAVYEIFSVKEWRDLENWVRGCSRSLKMAPFDRPYTSFYWRVILSRDGHTHTHTRWPQYLLRYTEARGFPWFWLAPIFDLWFTHHWHSSTYFFMQNATTVSSVPPTKTPRATPSATTSRIPAHPH